MRSVASEQYRGSIETAHLGAHRALAGIPRAWVMCLLVLATAIVGFDEALGQNLPPSVDIQPPTQTVTVGHQAYFWATALGAAPLSYQWRFGTNEILGATNHNYSIFGVQATNAGAYSVTVTNAFGSTTSADATLNVTPPEPLDLWTPVSSGSSNQLNAVVGSPSTVVAVGASGTVVTSTNRVDWSTQISGVSNNLNAIVCSHGLFVAGGDGGTILTSADGVSWSRQDANTTDSIYGLAFGNGVFVAVGASGLIATSSDGAQWAVRPSTTIEDIGTIAFGNGMFAAIGVDPFSLASTNGINWTSPAFINNLEWTGPLAFGGGNFVTFGGEETITSVWDVSADGVNWTAGYFRDGSPSGGITRAAAFGNGEFVLAADTPGPVGRINLDSVEAATLRADAATVNPPDESWFTFVFRQRLASNIQGIGFWRSRFVAVGDSGAIYLSGTLPPYLSQVFQSGNMTSVSMEGIPLESYVLQSAAIVNGPWKSVSTNTTSIDGTLTFIDPTPSLGGSRFYRVFGP